MRRWIAIVAIAASIAAPARAQLPDDVSALIGSYGGSYICDGREHGFYLDIASLTPSGTGGWTVDGMIGIFPILSGRDDRGAAPTGSFSTSGTLGADGALKLTPGDWRFTALGYGAPNLEGRLAVRVFGGFEIRGRAVFADNRYACSDLIATKFTPQPPALIAAPH